MGSGTEDRDHRGNVRSSGYTPDEAHRAGVKPDDSAYRARTKVFDLHDRQRRDAQKDEQDRTRRAAEFESQSGNGGSLDFGNGEGILPFLFIIAIIIGIIWFGNYVSKNVDAAKYKGMEEIAQQRFQRYSDFQPLSQWPSFIQEEYKKSTKRFIVPADFDSLPAEVKSKMGAVVWLRLVAEGENMRKAAGSTQHYALLPEGYPGQKQASLFFLRRQCARNLEVACLDAARLHSALVFKAGHHFDNDEVNRLALAELPTSGPLAVSPEIEKLRRKIESDTTPLSFSLLKYHFWDIWL